VFVLQGPIDPRQEMFVGRAAELATMEVWLRAPRCVGAVLGARQTGKTSLLLRAREVLGDQYGLVFVNLEAIESASPQICFAFVAEEILEQLTLSRSPEDRVPEDGPSFLRFLRRLATEIRQPRVGVFLDEVGALPQATSHRLSHTIRAIFTNRHLHRELERYLFLLAGSSDLLELTTGRNSPLKNVTESIYLADFGPDESRRVLREGFQSMDAVLTPVVEEAILAWTSGHPYWTQLLGWNSAAEAAQTAEDVDRVTRQLLDREDRNLPHLRRGLAEATDASRRALDQILGVVEAPPFSRHDSAVAPLELLGIIKEVDGRCAVRNRLYEEVLHEWRPAAARARTTEAWNPALRISQPLSVFVSYAHADETLRIELGKHLSVLERQGLISTWHDRMLGAGADWTDTIDQRLEEAQVILLLISADFVESKYCYDVEMKRALERHAARQALVVPVMLRPVALAGLPFGTLQALPKDAKAITDWVNRDSALVDVTEGLRIAIREFISRI
jgi:TIR domain/AAA-like domain